MNGRGRVTLVAASVLCSLAGGACVQVPEPQALVADLQPPRVTSVVDIGCEQCPALATPLAPRSLVLAGDEVWLLDAYEPHVRMFGLQGEELRAFGRAGQGPGELHLPIWLGRTSAGEALVYNGLPARLMRLDAATGRLLGAADVAVRWPMNLALHAPSQTLYRLSFAFGAENQEFDRLDILSGVSTQLLSELADHPSLPGTADGPVMGRQFPIVALGNRGFATGDAWNYVIRAYDRDGVSGVEIARSLPRPSAPGVEIDGFDPGAELPHFGKFALDHDAVHDVLWVMTHRGIASNETVFDLFAVDGAFVGSVTLPTTVSLDFKSFDAEGDYLASWSGNEEQGGTLAIWRVQWGDEEP